MTLKFGNTPVPWTVAWSSEERFFIGRCPYSGLRAICQDVAPGEGQPRFGKPHNQRQRKAIADGLCDLCGRTLTRRTKISLSHARMRSNGAEGPCIMQVEPLLHRECAAICVGYCPSLKKDIASGELMVRIVTRWRPQFAIMRPEYVSHYVPDYQASPLDRIVGHAKIELLGWQDRDAAWLGAAA